MQPVQPHAQPGVDDFEDELEQIDFSDPSAPFQHLAMQARSTLRCIGFIVFSRVIAVLQLYSTCQYAAVLAHSLSSLSVLYLGSEVVREKGPIDPLLFYREYVAANKPVIIESAFTRSFACCSLSPYVRSPRTRSRFFCSRSQTVLDAISHWPAMKKWCDEKYLREKVGERTISVQWTPNGT